MEPKFMWLLGATLLFFLFLSFLVFVWISQVLQNQKHWVLGLSRQVVVLRRACFLKVKRQVPDCPLLFKIDGA